MTVSIIIAVKTWQSNLEECVAKCLELDYDDFEILILPDEPFERDFSSSRVAVSVVPTGPVGPARKRDISAEHAKGRILAFLDDDAYPRRDWLANAAGYFQDERVAALGGPAVTPETDSLRQKAGGRIFASFLVSGGFIYRYRPRPKRDVLDYPSCNFLIRACVFKEAGGFNTRFWPGEDTLLCRRITSEMGYRIVYAPECLVYHHRRPVFRAHLRQVARYALHRGYFVKRFPENSRRPAYFVPSIFVLMLLLGAAGAGLSTAFARLYFSCLAAYLTIAGICSLSKTLGLIPLVFSGIIITHITYGIFFLKGLCARALSEE